MLRKPSPPPALTQLLPTDRLSAELRGVQQRASNELRGGRLEASSKVRAVAEFSLDAAMAAVGTSVGGRKVRSNEQAVDAEFSLDAALTALGGGGGNGSAFPDSNAPAFCESVRVDIAAVVGALRSVIDEDSAQRPPPALDVGHTAQLAALVTAVLGVKRKLVQRAVQRAAELNRDGKLSNQLAQFESEKKSTIRLLTAKHELELRAALRPRRRSGDGLVEQSAADADALNSEHHALQALRKRRMSPSPPRSAAGAAHPPVRDDIGDAAPSAFEKSVSEAQLEACVAAAVEQEQERCREMVAAAVRSAKQRIKQRVAEEVESAKLRHASELAAAAEQWRAQCATEVEGKMQGLEQRMKAAAASSALRVEAQIRRECSEQIERARDVFLGEKANALQEQRRANAEALVNLKSEVETLQEQAVAYATTVSKLKSDLAAESTARLAAEKNVAEAIVNAAATATRAGTGEELETLRRHHADVTEEHAEVLRRRHAELERHKEESATVAARRIRQATSKLTEAHGIEMQSQSDAVDVLRLVIEERDLTIKGLNEKFVKMEDEHAGNFENALRLETERIEERSKADLEEQRRLFEIKFDDALVSHINTMDSMLGKHDLEATFAERHGPSWPGARSSARHSSAANAGNVQVNPWQQQQLQHLEQQHQQQAPTYDPFEQHHHANAPQAPRVHVNRRGSIDIETSGSISFPSGQADPCTSASNQYGGDVASNSGYGYDVSRQVFDVQTSSGAMPLAWQSLGMRETSSEREARVARSNATGGREGGATSSNEAQPRVPRQ